MRPLVYLLLSSFCFHIEAQAQKVNLGVTIGNSFGNYKSSFQSESVTSKTRIGYTVGVITRVEVTKTFSFLPALNYVQKGGKLKTSDFTDRLILHYLEIPLNSVLTFPVRNNKFIVGGGPSFSFGMYGTGKWQTSSQSGKETIKFGSGSNKDFKTFETGANFMTGFISDDGFMILLNYNAGLTNILNTADMPGGKFRTRYFGLAIGQMLSRK
jgi:hypothetical protein